MNWRIYDPLLGRFLSCDPFVQAPDNLQSYNRYAYVMNNPLSLKDESGYFWSALVTVAFAAYDTYQYAQGNISGTEYAKNMAVNAAALVADVATLGQGGGLAVRAANAGVRVAKAIDKANDAYEAASAVGTAVESTVDLVGKVADGTVTLSDVGDAAMDIADAASGRSGKMGKAEIDLSHNKVSASKIDGVDPKKAPAANQGDAAPHGGENHNRTIDNDIDNLKNDPDVSNIRKNQKQADADGNLAGDNRPDVQFDKNGVHTNREYDTKTKSSDKHAEVNNRNDPNANNEGYVWNKEKEEWERRH